MSRSYLLALILLSVSCVTQVPKVEVVKPTDSKESTWSELEAAIHANEFPMTNGVLINLKGQTVYEGYFAEGSRDLLNDTRSVGKSFTALVSGQAIFQGKIKGVEAKILPFFQKELKHEQKSALRSDIRVKDLLTMSSAFDADDMNDKSAGNEDRMHEEKVWTPWAINLPLSKSFRRDAEGLGSFHYGTVQAFLMGQVIERATKLPVDQFMVKELFQPLGISRYEFQRSPAAEVMTGGSVRLRGIDLMKIGQLLLDGGLYQGKQIVEKKWIDESLSVKRKDPDSGAGYGYFIWNMDFESEGKVENAWFMAGNGGNIVLILKDLDAAVVLTRTNFNSPKGAGETIKLVTKYIIPKLRLKKQ